MTDEESRRSVGTRSMIGAHTAPCPDWPTTDDVSGVAVPFRAVLVPGLHGWKILALPMAFYTHADSGVWPAAGYLERRRSGPGATFPTVTYAASIVEYVAAGGYHPMDSSIPSPLLFQANMSWSLYGHFIISDTRPKKLFRSVTDGSAVPPGCECTVPT